jgi:hypothetical protein
VVQPVPGLTVTARSEHGDYRTQTADDGSYAFRGLPAGRYQVSIQPPAGRLALWGGAADHVGANAGLGNTCPVNFEVFMTGASAEPLPAVMGNRAPLAGHRSRATAVWLASLDARRGGAAPRSE